MSKKKKKPIKKLEGTVYPIVRIEWDDHVSSNQEWVRHKTDLAPRPFTCFSVGMVVHEDDKTITLAQNMTESEQLSCTMTILKNCITHTERLGTLHYVEAKAA